MRIRVAKPSMTAALLASLAVVASACASPGVLRASRQRGSAGRPDGAVGAACTFDK